MKYLEGHYYHVYNRGAHKQKIFIENENYLHLISLFKKYSQRYNVVVAAYCLMPNHHHLILCQKASGDIGGFLKTTCNAYTQAMNKRYRHSGTFFQGQSKAKHIDSDEYCLRAIRYVHRNPLAAHLVSSLKSWEYSNHLEWIELRQGTLADFELRNRLFKKPSDYQQFVEGTSDEKQNMELEKFLFN